MNNNTTATMRKYKIELTTFTDIKDFVNIASRCEGKVLIKCNDNYCINAKSLLGVIVAKKLNWNDLYVAMENDYYYDFKRFIID